MIAVEGKDFLRIVIFSGIVGFGIFCLSYGIHVWWKRSASLSRGRTIVVRAAQVTGLLGCFSMVGSWAFNEFQGRSGVAGGGDLYVVHARKDSTPLKVPAGDSVDEGAVLAEFMSPSDEARMNAIEAQQAKAKAKRDAVNSSPLVFDQAILQDLSHLRTEQFQLKGFAFDLQRSIRETEKNRSDLSSSWGREMSQVELELLAAQAELNSAASKLDVATRAFHRAQELQKRGLTYEQTLDQRASEQTVAALNLQRYTSVQLSSSKRLEALAARFRTDDNSFQRHLDALRADFSAVQHALSTVGARLIEAEARLEADRLRANRAITGEVTAAAHEVSVLAAEKDRLLEAMQVRAPFSGHVVYRAAAPGLVKDDEPILAISGGMGFTAKIRMPRGELDQLESTKQSLQLALDEPVLHKFFTGRFVRAEPVPFEPDRVIAQIECTLPPEIIAFLGSSSKLAQVRLLWRPPLIWQPGFLIGLCLMAASFALVIVNLTPSRARLKQLVQIALHHAPRAIPSFPNDSAEMALPMLAARFQTQLRSGH